MCSSQPLDSGNHVSPTAPIQLNRMIDIGIANKERRKSFIDEPVNFRSWKRLSERSDGGKRMDNVAKRAHAQDQEPLLSHGLRRECA